MSLKKLLFGCRHPFSSLRIYNAEPTKTDVDEDFIRVEFHLKCYKCGERLTLKCSSLRGGVDAFLNRPTREVRK